MSMDIDTALHALLRKGDSGVGGLQLLAKAAHLSKRQVGRRCAFGYGMQQQDNGCKCEPSAGLKGS
jgi:hypothetical protein